MYTIEQAAVIGAGTMGLGIAGQLANAGVDVLLLDVPSQGPNRNAICERALERLMNEQQPGLLHKDKLARIRIGNTEDDLAKIADADWIAEAVVERLEVKRALYRRIDAVRRTGSIVSSNTSTIPISLLVDGMPEAFRREFAITHFFNPVRYMPLLEIVRGEATLPEVIDCLERFNDERMGKGIVVCKDTPGFLGNRVGVFAIQTALHSAFRLGLSPEEADAIFGRPMGVPKTGVFGLYDLIGIDLMSDVARSLVDILPPEDMFHRVADEIAVMRRMIDAGLLGNKGGRGGFYRFREPGNSATRETLDFASFDYRPYDRSRPAIAVKAEESGDFTQLLEADDRYGRYAWDVLSDTLVYAAQLVPEVNESLVAIDDAMKLGYNWARGPFEMIDAIGPDRFVQRLQKEGRPVPAFLRAAVGKSFYRVSGGRLQHLLADGSWRDLRRAPGIRRFSEERRALQPVHENRAASYFVIDGDIGLVEFHTKANALDGDSMKLLEAALRHASSGLSGLVVHNDAPHFSCGVNLEAIAAFIDADDLDGLDGFLHHFQQTVKAMRMAPVPAVAAPSGLSVGGGFEVVLHADKVVCHANSVSGLVESLVGVVPGGGGVKELLYRWRDIKGKESEAAWQAFITVGYGKTARSPLEAAELAMFRPGTDEFVMNRDRLLDAAVRAVRALAPGYEPTGRGDFLMPGRQVWSDMQDWLAGAAAKGRLTPHDVVTGTQIAMIVTGGDVDAGTRMSEDEIFALERKAFLALAATDATRARIRHMLEFGKPLRN
ncbi:MAG: 3-hydroxyacyl-CoA dehydrogenase NAD-binding domain-containing protein [Gammaproteobacteria bacterium]|nr:3-hydroxyacyl-CoA dehydrogenase NAD-binding domain-containing protein [Gammaproteobacteria bacterium]MDH4254582.1 3-hydroxyacyl-CoA dehydrogenase NAD-binding domain-containing protein [Gammaproteobacteria bacterium]MDH5310459.1 3-hydroxyacyl-CoA dehydrogenase NAD-binding domain-containing protein [Gammaproteobacteria bacterium]